MDSNTIPVSRYQPNYDDLINEITNLSSINQVLLEYIDDENDRVTVKSQAEYEEALRLYKDNLISFIVRNASQPDLAMDLIMPHDAEISSLAHSNDYPNHPINNDAPNPSIPHEVRLAEVAEVPQGELSDAVKREIKDILRSRVSMQLRSEIVRIDALTTYKTCTSCNWEKIRGIYYECDLCEICICEPCEINFIHTHPMLKVRHHKFTFEEKVLNLIELGFSDTEARRGVATNQEMPIMDIIQSMIQG